MHIPGKAGYKQQLILLLLIVFLASCRSTQYLSDEEYLYTGMKVVKIEGARGQKERIRKDAVVYWTLYAKPNGSLFGIPVKLLPSLGIPTYYLTENYQNKGLKRWMNRYVGKKPVTLSDVDPESRVVKLQNDLFNLGNFHAKTRYELIYRGRGENRKRVMIKYYIDLGSGYTLDETGFGAQSAKIDSLMKVSEANSFLQEDNIYDLSLIKDEQERISRTFRDHGYYFFRKDHISVDADSSFGNHRVKLHMGISPDIPGKALTTFSLDTVMVVIHDEKRGETASWIDTVSSINGLHVIQSPYTLKPEFINKKFFLRENELFRLSNHQKTLDALNHLGVFRSLNIHYTESNQPNSLNATIYARPASRINAGIELKATTKSNGFAGPGIEVSVTQRNLFHKAIEWKTSLDGAFEWQLWGLKTPVLSVNQYYLHLKNTFTFHEILSPFRFHNKQALNLGKTSVGVDFAFDNLIQYYQSVGIKTHFTYTWKKNSKEYFSLSPVSINLFEVLKTTSLFDQALEDYPFLVPSFTQTLVAGLRLSYVFSDKEPRYQKSHYYLNMNLSTSGNLLNGIVSLMDPETSGDEEQGKIFGLPFSQYTLFSLDARNYLDFAHSKQLVSRIAFGIGLPYGNSQYLPYQEQFYTGGANHLRSFHSRTIGPGSYKPQGDQGTTYIEQTGEIKVEMNLEYRFRIAYKTHLGLFMDMGNIWLLKEDPSRPGGEFRWNQLFNEMALGAGAGLRFDLNYLILRFDFGYPLHTPFLESGDRWFFNGQNWKNPIFGYIAIGYPF